jgi:hypothetical protein
MEMVGGVKWGWKLAYVIGVVVCVVVGFCENVTLFPRSPTPFT